MKQSKSNRTGEYFDQGVAPAPREEANMLKGTEKNWSRLVFNVWTAHLVRFFIYLFFLNENMRCLKQGGGVDLAADRMFN